MRPALTPWPPHVQDSAARFLARRFTDVRADLDVEFDGAPRAALVTTLLGLCLHAQDGEPFDRGALWQWSVGERLQGLLAIALATSGGIMTAVAACGHQHCAEQVELELELEGFSIESPMAATWSSPDGERVQCRLPTGLDQQAWRAHAQLEGVIDEPWLAHRLVDSIDGSPPDGDWTIPAAWLEPIAASLDACDPLTALTIVMTCPVCERPTDVDVDLEHLLIERLRQSQRALLEDVHRLAAVYHWSEAEIVALPAWRRTRYLARIDAMET